VALAALIGIWFGRGADDFYAGLDALYAPQLH
jgi:hypothetical protein